MVFISSAILECPLISFNLVELEGIEPSSKRGINKLSTCLVCELVFEKGQAHDGQSHP